MSDEQPTSASDVDTTDDATSTDDVDAAAPEPAEQPELGDGGKKALTAERRGRREAERRLKAALAELASAREAQMTEQEKALAQARAETRAETEAEWSAKIVDSRIEAAAARAGMRRPEAAVKLVSRDTIAVDGGEIVGVDEAVAQLLEDMPELKAEPPRFQVPGDGGDRSRPVQQLTRKDLQNHQVWRDNAAAIRAGTIEIVE